MISEWIMGSKTQTTLEARIVLQQDGNSQQILSCSPSNAILAMSSEDLSLGFLARSDKNQAVQPQAMTRGLIFQTVPLM